ncbi:hypothetical protein [Paenibacillus sp. PCH8]|uniref:hypothetical protein n=1 Tax=Paenibacillus sp. PCH8 TaxID=2066524 RepID=UPI0015E3E1A5|nr:hypothetical protein [Paenibacillus sp. PCH8]
MRKQYFEGKYFIFDIAKQFVNVSTPFIYTQAVIALFPADVTEDQFGTQVVRACASQHTRQSPKRFCTCHTWS